MYKYVRKLLPKWLRKRLTPHEKAFESLKTLLFRYAQFPSMFRWSCIDRENQPIPWFTYPAIEFLSHLDFSKMNILEYGSGNSTLWWMNRCQELVSVEHDVEWHKKISEKVSGMPNFCYQLEIAADAYVRRKEIESSDVVIIDGEFRGECADWVISRVNKDPDGLAFVIFDNADWYPNTIQKLRETLGWPQADFHGFGPINSYTWTTTVYMNPTYKNKVQYCAPLRSVAGLVKTQG